MTHLEKLKSTLGGKNPDAIIITSEINQFYISGFHFSDGYILVTKNNSYLITDFRYTQAAHKMSEVGLIVTAPTGGMLNFIREALAQNDCRSAAFEEATLSYSRHEKLKSALPGVELTAGASEILDGMRAVKDKDEQAQIAAAQAITDEAFTHILNFLTPKMTEREVALELEFFMRRRGADGVSFDIIAVSGTASSMPHGTPRNILLERGFLTLDYGAKLGGYCSDMTRTVVIGRADSEMKRLYNTVLTAQSAALEAIVEGANQRHIDKAARDIINGAGYAGCFGHGLGHGVGLYIHEAPRLSPAAPEGECLRAGQVVTVEPGIYIAEKYGCRIEDMVCVSADGYYNFTHSKKDLIELF